MLKSSSSCTTSTQARGIITTNCEIDKIAHYELTK